MRRHQGTARLLAVAAAVLLTTLTAACGSDTSTPSVATAVTAEPTVTKPTHALSNAETERAAYVKAQQAWVGCLRDHGLDPPDPDHLGRVLWRDVPAQYDAAFEKGQQACKPLQSAMPKSVAKMQVVPLTDGELDVLRRYATCMRANGAPDFRDPKPDGFTDDAPWNETSAGAKRAQHTCASIIGDPATTGPGVG